MMRLPAPSAVEISHHQMNGSSRTMISSARPNPMMKLPSVLSLSDRSKKRFTRRKCTPASTTLANPPVKSPPSFLDSFRVDEKPTEEAAAIVIDEWMEDSVTGIVQNLKQAPLLVHVYPEFNRRGSNSKFGYKFDKAVLENWPIITKSMRKIKKSPIGLIFVDELLDEESSGDNHNNSNNNNAGVKSEGRREAAADGVTRAWGILVQGKGVKSGPTCYLLKTTRVEASSHFCLTKVTNFRETALKQLQDSWLQQ